MSNKKMVNIRVNTDLWHQAKVEAVKQGISLQEWLNKAILTQLTLDLPGTVAISKK